MARHGPRSAWAWRAARCCQRAKENPQFFGALSATAQGKFLPQTGAVVIKDMAGNVLGAAGASGGTGDEDEAVCIAGVEAAGLMHG